MKKRQTLQLLAIIAATAALPVAAHASLFTGTDPSSGQMTLWVNTATGDVELVGNNTPITGYQISSPSGSLVFGSWTKPITHVPTIGWGPTKSSGNYIAEVTSNASYAVTTQDTHPYDEGNIFNPAAAHDLALRFALYNTVTGSSSYTPGSVQYSSSATPTLTWDPGLSHTTSGSDGAGNWDTTTAIWSNGSTDQAWTNGNVASIGANGTGNTITIDTTGITAAGITFNPLTTGQYTIAAASGNNLTLSGDITLNANATISAPIVGTGAITIVGPDTLTLSGTNTYSGGTTIESGSTVNFTNASAFGTGTISFGTGGGTLQYGAASLILGNNLSMAANGTIDTNGLGDPTSGVTLAGNITGSANLTINSSVAGGELYLTGSNGGFTGNTTLENGVEAGISTGTAFGSGTITIGTGGGTVEYDAAVSVNNSLVLSNSGAGINMHGEAGTWAGVISGANGLLIHDTIGGGALTLTNVNTYSGSTTIGKGNAVTLALSGSGSIADSSGVSIASGGTFDISATTSGASIVSLGGVSGSSVALGGQTLTITNAATGANGTFAGIISGTGGGLTLSAGAETLSGANTYTGGTTINGGTLSISADNNLGSAGGITFGGGTLQTTAAITDGRSVTLNTSGGTIDTAGTSDTFSGAFTGSGGLTLTSSISGGTLTLSGTNAYTGGTAINSGTLALSVSGSIADSSGVSIASGGTFDISATTSGASIVSLGGVSGSSVALGGQTLTITNAATGANGTFAGIITGTGGGLTLSAGAETLSGANTYTGGTTINGGTLSISADNNLGSAGGLTFGGGTLQTTAAVTDSRSVTLNVGGGTINNGGYADTFSGAFGGVGGLTSAGTGTLTLSGANTYSGGTTINSGTLIAANNAALGTGTLALVGGALETPLVASAGVSGSNITLNTGNYTQSSGTTLGLAFSGTPASGKFDSLNVTGSAALNGKLDVLVLSGAKPNVGAKTSYNIITTTTGVSGGFSSLVLDPRSVLDVSLLPGAISGNDYVLTLLGGFNFAASAQNSNQLALANYLDNIGNSGTLPAGPFAFLQTLNNLTPGQLSVALAEIAPNAYTNLPNTLISASIFNSEALNGQIAGQFEGGGFNTSGLTLLKTTNTDPFSLALAAALQSNSKVNAATTSAQYLDDVMQPAQGNVPLPSRETAHDSFGGFIAGEAILGSQPTSTSGQNYFTGGINSGLDYRFAKSLLVGISFNYSYTNAHVDGVGSVLTDNSYAPGLFAGYRKDNFYADVSADYTYTQFSIHRNLNIGGTVSTATGKPDTNQADLNTLIGYNFPVCSHFKAGPAIGLDYTHINVSSLSETGSSGDLSVSRYSIDSLRSLLGGQAEYKLMIPKMPMPLTISANAFWQHEYLNNSHGITAALAGAGSGSFITNVPNPGRDSALLGAGVSGKICRNATLFANYEAQIGPKDQHTQSIMVGMAVSF